MIRITALALVAAASSAISVTVSEDYYIDGIQGVDLTDGGAKVGFQDKGDSLDFVGLAFRVQNHGKSGYVCRVGQKDGNLRTAEMVRLPDGVVLANTTLPAKFDCESVEDG